MAPPKPKAHRPQTQPMTVLLRSICLDYPAGCGILREILQNADDAGASRVRFVLDLNSYPTNNLLHADLAQYQGPALLAYNNAVFPAEDFESLSRIGDSRKLQDGYSTGKFGRGFNSVYNWTDSPSIVSEDTLLILDPHHRWSATLPNCTSPGGPMWDFVADGGEVEMKNQMSAFSTIMKERDKYYNGTIIRIPLRTASQAEASEICKGPTTVSDVDEVLRKFASEFGTSGLLFMKNIESIEIEIGATAAFSMKICNSEHVRMNKRSINEVIRAAPAGLERPFDVSFDVEIESESPTLKRRTSLAVHHSVASHPADERLRNWCKTQAMIPWVAVAAPISGDAPERGSLFTVLPLQIPTNQPVYIHGLFSLSSDRARLHENNDGGVQDPLPAQWNAWLFARLVPMAWVNMLLQVKQRDPGRAAFDKWPLAVTKRGDILDGMIQKILEIVKDEAYQLWYTNLGYQSSSIGLLANGDEPLAVRKALYGVEVPVIYLPDALLHVVQCSNIVERLSPRSLCTRLERNRNKMREVHEDTKQVLLEYILSDPGYNQYGAVEVFPFEDGTYKSIDQFIAFVPHDKEESALFDRDRSRTVDLGKLSKKTMQVLRDGFSHSYLHSSLQRRSSNDLKAYCMSTYFKDFDPNQDFVFLDDGGLSFVSKVWDWIIARGYGLGEICLSCLWLVPLSNGQYRKLKPQNLSSGTIYAPPGETGDFLRKMAALGAVPNKPIIRSDSVPPRALKLFIDASANDSSMLVKNGAALDDFCHWLTNISEVLEQAPDADKLHLHKLLVSHRHLCQDVAAISKELRGLKIFQEMMWTAKNNLEPSLNWASLNGYTQAIGLRDSLPVPCNTKTIFLDARSEITSRFLMEFQLAGCPTTTSLLQEVILLYWEDGYFEGLSISCREHITSLFLSHFYNFQKRTQKRVASLVFIPTCRFDGKTVSKLATAAQLVDSSSDLLRSLHLDDEEVYPVDWAVRKFRGVLIECGLQISITQDLVKGRIRCFANTHSSLEKIWDRARKLLQSKVDWLSSADAELSAIIRELKWLPATNCHGKKILASASHCRGLEDHLLVGLVHPLVNFDFGADWKQRLGWNEVIPSPTLLEQLMHGIEKEDGEIVNAVLKYIEVKGRGEILSEKLANLRCVMTQAGRFVRPQTAFHIGCERLEPYLHNVDKNFWNNNSLLLSRLEIKERPSLADLFQVQRELQQKAESNEKATLDERDTGVAVEIVKLASIFDREQLSNLMIATALGSLCKIEEATYNDLGSFWHAQGKINFTHPDISRAVIEQLRIEPLSERVQKGELGLADDEDDDNFDQHEQVATGIADTLERYPVEATFKEYLANADDAKANEINWLLDSRLHPQESLVAPGLSAYQGPAMLVHNDGTFQGKDFDGFKDVGRGSKREDPTTIGKFGRGSQTMYHWTDVPMLLSGEYLLILDPLQQVLQMNYRTGRRKPGVKIKLSKLKSYCLDQLAPFDGLWGYSRELEYYDGTIFRFPLRPATVQSKLRESKTVLNYDAAQLYMEQFLGEARISLLFLRNVRSIDFKIFEDNLARWSVISSRTGIKDYFSDWTICTVTKGDGSDLGVKIEDRWWTAVQDTSEFPTKHLHRHKRSMKDVECGIAALVSSKPASKNIEFLAAPKARIFSSLPLPLQWDLPVHIHATFITFGDRNSIMIESSAREDGADWNRWLLTTAIPNLYLPFLEDLARKVGQDAFRFWPKEAPTEDSLSNLVYNSFWKQLSNSSCRLFPCQPSNKRRQPPKLLELKEATFGFRHNVRWGILRNFLESQIPTLVRVPLAVSKKLLSSPMVISSVTPSLLRKLFRSEATAEHFAKIQSKIEALEALLKEIIPKCDADFEELNGCRVIPLVDGTMGMLSIQQAQLPSITYYNASKREVEIFDFARELLTPEDQGTDFKVELLNYTKGFNIKRLDLLDVGTLLGKKTFHKITHSPQFGAWLRQFWKFWHEGEITHMDSAETIFMSASGVYNYPILEATCDGVKTYLRPSDLLSFPSVVEPENEQHKNMCDKISGLYRLDRHCIPSYLKEAEASLHYAPSFSRLIKSLSVLASGGLETYIRKIFGEVELEVFRQLVKNYFAMDPSDQFALKDHIKLLPIWPTVSISSPCIAAYNALVANDYELLVPQMSEYGQFLQSEIATSYFATLSLLGVQKIADTNLLEIRIRRHLPRKLATHDEKDYELFIGALARVWEDNYSRNISRKAWKKERNGLKYLLRNSNLAPDGNGVLRTANALFDHSNSIFLAAFREEAAARFLMTAVRRHKKFWLEIGLQQREDMHFERHYILCLQTMRKRLEARDGTLLDPQLEVDAHTVLEPLTSTTYNPYSNFLSNEWLTIQEEAIFPVLTALSNQPNYRQDSMADLAVVRPLLLLKDLVMPRYTSICWSQIPFPLVEPSQTTISKIALHGRPPANMVWSHLKTLMQLAQHLTEDAIPNFLSDLTSTYDYLQENLNESCNDFIDVTSTLWLNLSITDNTLVFLDDLRSSWFKIEHLVLSSPCDSPPLMSVQPRLMRHERLLKALGCRTIIYPTVVRPEASIGESLSALMTRMRHERKMLDITFSAEGNDVQAHKILLAAASDYFAAHINGRWAEEPKVKLDDISFHTLSMVVDFIYTDAFDWTPMRATDKDELNLVADKLDNLLDLLTAADRFLMPALRAQVENEILYVGRLFIRIDNVLDIRTRAAEANAHHLERACTEFYEQNKIPVDLIYNEREI